MLALEVLSSNMLARLCKMLNLSPRSSDSVHISKFSLARMGLLEAGRAMQAALAADVKPVAPRCLCFFVIHLQQQLRLCMETCKVASALFFDNSRVVPVVAMTNCIAVTHCIAEVMAFWQKELVKSSQ